MSELGPTITELEPTITELEPTATERPQALLDDRWEESGYPHTLRPELHKALMARGIDYWVAQGITFWNRDDGCECLAYGYKANGVPKLAIKVVGFTDPEQAIAATLGSCNCSNSERTSDSDATAERRGDAVEVVRCRDCRHYRERINGCVEFGDESRGEYANVEPDGFCAWGRKVDA